MTESQTDLTLARLDAAIAELRAARDELAERLTAQERRWAEHEGADDA